MLAKHILLLSVVVVLSTGLTGCCYRRSACRTDDTRYYDPGCTTADSSRSAGW